MKIGLFSPYLDTLGGGEKYLFDIAVCLVDKHEIDIFWNDKGILAKAEYRFNISLSKVNCVNNIFSGRNSIKKSLLTKKYDVIFYVSDGSFPILLSKRNFLIIQFPVNWIVVNPVYRVKLTRIKTIICYSDFVKKYLVKKFKKETIVIAPQIDIERNKSINKENIILSVGRFTKGMNRKKQEILIKTFKELVEDGFKGWKLVIVGSYRDEDKDFYDFLNSESQNYPIEVLGNISYSQLQELYNKAKIYWHAAGYDEDLDNHPEKAEHFGITTVEAMRCGAVPIVIDAGGQSEIVENGKSGYKWSNLNELKKLTVNLADNEQKLNELSIESEKRSELFSKEEFNRNINKILE